MKLGGRVVHEAFAAGRYEVTDRNQKPMIATPAKPNANENSTQKALPGDQQDRQWCTPPYK